MNLVRVTVESTQLLTDSAFCSEQQSTNTKMEHAQNNKTSKQNATQKKYI